MLILNVAFMLILSDREHRISAAVTSLYWDRSNKVAWAELVDLASAAPHVPTLLDLFGRVPADARPRVLTKLISLSRGRDRLGNMRPADGERLRAALAAMAETEGDKPTIRKLSADTRKHQGSNARNSAGGCEDCGDHAYGLANEGCR